MNIWRGRWRLMILLRDIREPHTVTRSFSKEIEAQKANVIFCRPLAYRLDIPIYLAEGDNVTNTMKTGSNISNCAVAYGSKQERCVSLGKCLGEFRIIENSPIMRHSAI